MAPNAACRTSCFLKLQTPLGSGAVAECLVLCGDCFLCSCLCVFFVPLFVIRLCVLFCCVCCCMVWCVVVWCGVVCCVVVWCVLVWCVLVRCVLMWCVLVWCVLVWCVLVWCGSLGRKCSIPPLDPNSQTPQLAGQSGTTLGQATTTTRTTTASTSDERKWDNTGASKAPEEEHQEQQHHQETQVAIISGRTLGPAWPQDTKYKARPKDSNQATHDTLQLSRPHSQTTEV